MVETEIELRQLKIFQTVTHLMNFNREAATLGYAQSTVSVSAQIKLLKKGWAYLFSIGWESAPLLLICPEE